MKLFVLLIVWLNVLIAPDGLATQLTVSAFAIAIASLAAKMLCAALLIVGVEFGARQDPHPASAGVSRRHFRALVPRRRALQPGALMALAEAVLATLILIATFGLLIARQVRGAINWLCGAVDPPRRARDRDVRRLAFATPSCAWDS